jgi:2,4-dienoyl-CoA reductase-like NADH-dependent reductase (Old Yellow Enzyme family)
VERDKNIAEGVEAAKILVEAGYDLLNVDAGSCDTWYWNHPPVHFEKGMYCDFGKILKENVNVPIILADIMDNPDRALSTCCDIIGYGRTQSAKIIFQKKSGSKSFRVSVNTFPSVWTVRIDSQEENFKSIETLMSLLARNRKTREERS